MATAKDTLHLTTRLIDRRAFHYRNLVVLVVLVVVISLVWAVVQFSAIPLFGVLLLLPLCGGFLCLDTILVNRWRERILGVWADDQLDLDGFAMSITSIRLLPPATLQGMLSTLPTSDKIPAADKLSPTTRRAIAATLKTINRGENNRLCFASGAYACGAASVVVAIIQWSWIPLVGILLVGPLYGVAWWVQAARWRSWRRTLVVMQRQQGLELEGFVRVAGHLDWEAVPEKKKQQRLNSLTQAG